VPDRRLGCRSLDLPYEHDPDHIPDLDEAVEQKLRIQAAIHGRSLEEEAREILTSGVQVAKTASPFALTRKVKGQTPMALS
jgi:plasmid stability protein